MTFVYDRIHYIRGIVSMNEIREDEDKTSCNSDGYVLFTDVAKYLPWIEKASTECTKKVSCSITSYTKDRFVL